MPGAPPPSEPRAFPEAWDCLLSVHSIIHQSHACKFAAGLAARKKPLACFALRSGVFGLLLRALRSLSLLARASAQHCYTPAADLVGIDWCYQVRPARPASPLPPPLPSHSIFGHRPSRCERRLPMVAMRMARHGASDAGG